MTETKEISNNGWQNIGIMKQHIRIKNMNWKYRIVFMEIVESSFGYMQLATGSKSTREWADSLSMDKMTFSRHVNWLANNNFIKINEWTGFVKGGGSKSNTYSPSFPNNAHIKIKDLTNKSPVATGSNNFRKICDLAFDKMNKKQKDKIFKWNKETFNYNKSKGINNPILIYDYFQKHQQQLLMYSEPEKYILKFPEQKSLLESEGLIETNINQML